MISTSVKESVVNLHFVTEFAMAKKITRWCYKNKSKSIKSCSNEQHRWSRSWTKIVQSTSTTHRAALRNSPIIECPKRKYSATRIKAIFSSLRLSGNCHYPKKGTALASLKRRVLVVVINREIAIIRISFNRVLLY